MRTHANLGVHDFTHSLYILPNLSVLVLCLRINDSGLFAWISLTKTYAITLKSTALCKKCITLESSNISRIVLSCVSAITSSYTHTRTHPHSHSHTLTFILHSHALTLTLNSHVLAPTCTHLSALTRTHSRVFTHMH